MSFRTNHEERRTWDPERGIELISLRATRDRRFHFELRSDHSTYKFAARAVEDPSEAESILPSERTIVWRVYWRGTVPGLDLRQTAEIITEAMTSFRFIHGLPIGGAVRVEFSPSMNVET
jgi:hypothetical protein